MASKQRAGAEDTGAAPAVAQVPPAKAAEPVAAPPPPSRIGQIADWVPGRYPKKWHECTDEQLEAWGLTRPSAIAAPAADTKE